MCVLACMEGSGNLLVWVYRLCMDGHGVGECSELVDCCHKMRMKGLCDYYSFVLFYQEKRAHFHVMVCMPLD